MNTNHLKYFYDVYRLESVVDAAKASNVAASTVSQALRSLENELGFQLTSKQRGQLTLSKKAQEIALKIPAVLEQIEEIRSFKTSKISELQGTLRIATHQSLVASHLWLPIRIFKKKYPKVELSLMTGIGSHLSSLLSQRQVDVIVSLEHPRQGNELKSHILHKGRFVLVGSNSASFTKNSSVMATNKTKEEVRYLIKKNPWIQIEEMTNWSTIKSIITNEDSYGYLPDYLVQQEVKKGILHKVVKVKNQDFQFQISSWFKKESATDPIIVQFNELAESSFKEAILK